MARPAPERIFRKRFCVIYWQRWIGRWKRKTVHLTACEKGLYGELLDYQYWNECPLPESMIAIARIAGAQSDAEIAALERVLAEFFEKCDGGYTNKTAEEEIGKRHEFQKAQRERANMRWHRTGGHAAADGNGAWWKTEAGIEEKGKELGLAPERGETYRAYKDRLFKAIEERSQNTLDK